MFKRKLVSYQPSSSFPFVVEKQEFNQKKEGTRIVTSVVTKSVPGNEISRLIPKRSDYSLDNLLAAGVPIDFVNPMIMQVSNPHDVQVRQEFQAVNLYGQLLDLKKDSSPTPVPTPASTSDSSSTPASTPDHSPTQS